MEGVLGALRKAQEALRSLRVNPDAIPKLAREAVHVLNSFSGYARRATSELGHHGLKSAVD
jgi:hypothetical protein